LLDQFYDEKKPLEYRDKKTFMFKKKTISKMWVGQLQFNLNLILFFNIHLWQKDFQDK
jgi:hypothetical protein